MLYLLGYYWTMIGQLRGKITHRGEKHLILDVGGVGYKVTISPETKLSLSTNNAEISLWTYLAVREDALDLYGFLNRSELEFFELLIGISGVGPKSALGILSLASPETLSQAIGRNDTAYLTKVSGIGRKLAEKIVLELKDKIPYLEDITDLSFQQDTDVMLALQSMGYGEREIREVLKKIPAEVTDTSAKIKLALKNFHQ